MSVIFILGAGFMGAGIAQVCAQSGHRVHLMDSDPEAIKKSVDSINWSLDKFSEKGLLMEPSKSIADRITVEVELEKATTADWIIEAVFENLDLKLKIFEELDRVVSSRTLIATNTSSIPVSRLAEATGTPERVLGLHFFGPVPFMELVEVVKGAKTSDIVFHQGIEFVKSLGKIPLKVHQDIPGFVVNRIFGAAFRECVHLVAEGVASVEDIDAGMRLGYGWNIGPFEIADNAGLDTFARVGETMLALGEDHLVAKPDFIKNMVKDGRLGKKVGRGFYRYGKDGKKLE